LKDIPEKIYIVVVIRRIEFLREVAPENLKTLPPVFWAQQGLENEAAPNLFLNEGGQVIINRCI
ncbi:CoA-binding protein, partial [Enterococcus faecalis]|uniref:CoA-binding protein n=1 Tax=Enterococcus faecalis TaxID=1351 RepID=UPI0031CD8654